MHDDCLRGRSLTEQQVLAVNYIMKTRADRYVAGRLEEDLSRATPEVHAVEHPGRWTDAPDPQAEASERLHDAPDEEGKWHLQDQFGRKPKSRAEYDSEVERAERMHADVQRIVAKHDAEKRAKDAEGD
jgi:hypothetical protein